MDRVCEYQISFYQICIFEFAVKLHIAKFHLQENCHVKCNVLETTLCDFFVIEKQSSEEGM